MNEQPSVVPVREVIRWPQTRTTNQFEWWIVDNRGTKEKPLFEPVSGPYRTKRQARAAMEALR